MSTAQFDDAEGLDDDDQDEGGNTGDHEVELQVMIQGVPSLRLLSRVNEVLIH